MLDDGRLYQGRKHVRAMQACLVVLALIALAVLPRVDPGWPWLVGAVVCFLLAWRFGRTGIRLGPGGVQLVKLTGTESYSWDEVDGFTFAPVSGLAKLRLHNGRARPIGSIEGLEVWPPGQEREAAEVVAELNRLAETYKGAVAKR